MTWQQREEARRQVIEDYEDETGRTFMACLIMLRFPPVYKWEFEWPKAHLVFCIKLKGHEGDHLSELQPKAAKKYGDLIQW